MSTDAPPLLTREAEDLKAKLEEARAEIADMQRLIDRMSFLLRGVAAGLLGEPPELVMHDWSRLPVLAAQAAKFVRVVGKHPNTNVEARR